MFVYLALRNHSESTKVVNFFSGFDWVYSVEFSVLRSIFNLRLKIGPFLWPSHLLRPFLFPLSHAISHHRVSPNESMFIVRSETLVQSADGSEKPPSEWNGFSLEINVFLPTPTSSHWPESGAVVERLERVIVTWNLLHASSQCETLTFEVRKLRAFLLSSSQSEFISSCSFALFEHFSHISQNVIGSHSMMRIKKTWIDFKRFFTLSLRRDISTANEHERRTFAINS